MDVTDEKIQKAIKNTLDIFEMLDPDNYLRVKDDMESMTREELINFLINPIQVYFDPGNEIKPSILDKVISKEKIVITEPVEMY